MSESECGEMKTELSMWLWTFPTAHMRHMQWRLGCTLYCEGTKSRNETRENFLEISFRVMEKCSVKQSGKSSFGESNNGAGAGRDGSRDENVLVIWRFGRAEER